MRPSKSRKIPLTLERILNFVRRDGPENAPICFLSIEDGGGFAKDGSFNEEEFVKFYSDEKNEIWIPSDEERPLTLSHTGIPGEFIAKIMCGIFSDLNKWSDYRADKLYSTNEINIKFYPISRKTTKEWHEFLEKYLGLTLSEYIVFCHAERPHIIHEKLKHIFSDNQRIFIILGARDEWIYLSKRYTFKDKNIERKFYKGKDHNFELFLNEDNKLLFAYYNIFLRGARSTSRIEAFCNEVRKYLPKQIFEKIKL